MELKFIEYEFKLREFRSELERDEFRWLSVVPERVRVSLELLKIQGISDVKKWIEKYFLSLSFPFVGIESPASVVINPLLLVNFFAGFTGVFRFFVSEKVRLKSLRKATNIPLTFWTSDSVSFFCKRQVWSALLRSHLSLRQHEK